MASDEMAIPQIHLGSRTVGLQLRSLSAGKNSFRPVFNFLICIVYRLRIKKKRR